MHFLRFDLEDSGADCEYDGVAIGDMSDDEASIDAFDWSERSHVKRRYCGKRHFTAPVFSATNRVGIVFYANSKREGRGFSLLWSKVRIK